MHAQAERVKTENAEGFDGAVSGPNVAAEMMAILRLLRWLLKNKVLLRTRGWAKVILSFDAGVGCLVALRQWFCLSEPGLTLALWRAVMLVEEEGFQLFPH